jgi:hypothetical protein
MSRVLIGSFAVLALGAALTREALASPKADPTLKMRCATVFERERACTDTFIPALVDARVALDLPAGIAARAKSEGRDALIAAARDEWAKDSQDTAIATTCDRVAGSARGADFAAAGEACAKQSDCGGFVACVIPVLRDTILRR